VRTTSHIASIVIGVALIIGGLGTWIVASSTLSDENITVSEDSSCLAGDHVDGPFSAFCEANTIKKHALEATGGKTYAEIGREDPLRDVAATASYLRASLFTSVVAFGVAGMAMLIGVLFVLIGLGMEDVDNRMRSVSEKMAGDPVE
jgi:hypothetical protein